MLSSNSRQTNFLKGSYVLFERTNGKMQQGIVHEVVEQGLFVTFRDESGIGKAKVCLIFFK